MWTKAWQTHSHAKLGRVFPELLQQFSVAGIWQELPGLRIVLQLLVKVGHREGVHNRFLCWQLKTHRTAHDVHFSRAVQLIPALYPVHGPILTFQWYQKSHSYTSVVTLLHICGNFTHATYSVHATTKNETTNKMIWQILPASRASMFCKPSFSCWLFGSWRSPSWYVALASAKRLRNSRAAALRE